MKLFDYEDEPEQGVNKNFGKQTIVHLKYWGMSTLRDY